MRPNEKTIERNLCLINAINETIPDIIILTETNSVIDFSAHFYTASTNTLPHSFQGQHYEPGENRVTIYSRYPILQLVTTADSYNSVCAEIATPLGDLCVYATVIGFLGGKHKSFEKDLEKQLADLAKLTMHKNVCFCGDLNISFSGYPYPGKSVIKKVILFFDNHDLVNVTAGLPDNAMHNVLNGSFLRGRKVSVTRTTVDKKITDHSLIKLELIPG